MELLKNVCKTEVDTPTPSSKLSSEVNINFKKNTEENKVIFFYIKICMYIYMCVYIYIYIYIFIYIYLRAYIYII